MNGGILNTAQHFSQPGSRTIEAINCMIEQLESRIDRNTYRKYFFHSLGPGIFYSSCEAMECQFDKIPNIIEKIHYIANSLNDDSILSIAQRCKDTQAKYANYALQVINAIKQEPSKTKLNKLKKLINTYIKTIEEQLQSACNGYDVANRQDANNRKMETDIYRKEISREIKAKLEKNQSPLLQQKSEKTPTYLSSLHQDRKDYLGRIFVYSRNALEHLKFNLTDILDCLETGNKTKLVEIANNIENSKKSHLYIEEQKNFFVKEIENKIQGYTEFYNFFKTNRDNVLYKIEQANRNILVAIVINILNFTKTQDFLDIVEKGKNIDCKTLDNFKNNQYICRMKDFIKDITPTEIILIAEAINQIFENQTEFVMYLTDDRLSNIKSFKDTIRSCLIRLECGMSIEQNLVNLKNVTQVDSWQNESQSTNPIKSKSDNIHEPLKRDQVHTIYETLEIPEPDTPNIKKDSKSKQSFIKNESAIPEISSNIAPEKKKESRIKKIFGKIGNALTYPLRCCMGGKNKPKKSLNSTRSNNSVRR
jgi:hypothetical protein